MIFGAWHNTLDKEYVRSYIEACARPDSGSGCVFWLGIRGGDYPYPKMQIGGRLYLITTLSLWIMGRISKPVVGTKWRKCHCHTCDNGRCINPNHIFLSNHKGNMRDAVLKGRHHNTRKTICKHGHSLLDPLNVRVNGTARKCRACQRNRYRRVSGIPQSSYRGSYIERDARLTT